MACSVIRNKNTNEIERVLAPNGEDSLLFNSILSNTRDRELALKYWAMVYTPSFKSWFGDWENSPETSSKVLDKNGEPLVVYHGTGENIDIFKIGGVGLTYFSDNPDYAAAYATRATEGIDEIKRVLKNKINNLFRLPNILDGAFNLDPTVSYLARNYTVDQAVNIILSNIDNPQDILPERTYTEPEDEDDFRFMDKSSTEDFSQKALHIYSRLYALDDTINIIEDIANGTQTEETAILKAWDTYKDRVSQYSLIPTFLNIREPQIIADKISNESIRSGEIKLDPSKDGLIGKDAELLSRIAGKKVRFDNENVFAIKQPTQVKSITNTGRFSGTNPNIYQQASDTPTPSRASAKTLRLVNEFLRKAGFDVRTVNQVTVNGEKVSANGVANMLERVVQIVYGKEDTTLPEEAMHVAVEMVEQQYPELFNRMLNSISSYTLYSDILSAYRSNPFYMKDGKPDIRKIKKEAIARVLVETIINQTEGSVEKPENLVRATSWWQQILDWFKQLFNRYGNPFEEVVTAIVTEQPFPPIPEGYTRLYRGETAEAVDRPLDPETDARILEAIADRPQGSFFTDNIEEAKYYDEKFGTNTGNISYIDVPTADIEKYRASNNAGGQFSAKGMAEFEYFLPPEVAKNKRTYRYSGTSDEIFLHSAPQEAVYNRIKEIHDKLSLVENPDRPGESDYYIDNKKIGKRVSSKTKAYYNDKFRGKQINEDELQKALNDQKAEAGTRGHKDLENMFHRLIDDDGFVRDEPLPQASPSNLNPTDNTMYNTLWQNLQERLSSFPAGTRFMSEVMIYDKKQDIAGTMDFVAIEPNGKVNILDWKFINLREGEKDIPWYKVGAWNIQLSEYKRILRDAYAIKKDNFRMTRVIPIRAKYRFKPGTTDQLEMYSVQIGSVDVKAITDNTILPVNTRDEPTGNKKLDKMINNLYNLMDKIYETRAKPGEEYIKIERYNDLTAAVRQLHVKMATDDFLDFVYEDVKERIYTSLNPYFVLADAANSEDPAISDPAIEQLNGLSDINALAQEILSNEDILDLYSNIGNVLRTVLDPSNDENRATLQKAEQVVANANITKSKIITLSNALRSNPIARGLRVQDILDPELSISAYQKWVRSISQGATAAVDMLWRIVNNISNSAEIEFSDDIRQLTELEGSISEYKQKTGKSWTDIKKMFLSINSKGEWNGKVISQVSQEFYTELEKAKNARDVQRVFELIDQEEYNKWYEQELKNREDSYKNRRLFADEEKDREEKEKRINDFKKQFDIYGEASTAISPANKKLNAYPNLSKFASEQYKELRDKPENKPVLDLYNWWLGKLNDSYDLGMIKAWERKTFFPNVRKDLLDKYVFGSKDKKMRRTTLSFLNSMSIKVDDEVYGYTDVNGNPQDRLSAMYTYDLGEKIIDEDGNEFTDYSNKSTDLFKVMALWSKEMAKFKHKSEVVDVARLLYFTETHKQAQARSKLSGRPMVKETGDPVLIDNVVNSDYYKSYMDYYFYGRKLSEGQDIRITIPVNKIASKINKTLGTDIIPLNVEDEVTISGRKAVQTANRWFQMKTLGLNLTTAASNFFGGTTNALINAGKFFNKKDFFKAQMIISSGKLWGDNSIYAGLIDYFLPLTDDRTKEEADKLSVNRAVRLLSSDNLFYLMRASDKMVQYPAFIAFAENTVVEDGQLVNIREWVKAKNGYDRIYNLPVAEQKELTNKIEREIEELKNTRSLPKISSIENDRLVIPGIDRNSKTVHSLRNRVQQFAKDALGNMSQEDISLYRMTILGQSFMMFKNWIPRMADVRFGEFRYNPGTETYEWGRLRMLFSSLKFGIISGAKSAMATIGGKKEGIIEIAKKLYEEKKLEQEKKGRTFNMSEAEFIDNYIKGVRSQLKELQLMVVMMATFMFMKANAPDPDEDARTRGAFKWAARLFDKMTDEISFFYNPLSFTAIANGSIFPSIQILNDLVHLTTNMTLEGFYFATGNEEALEKNKVAKYLFRTFPITKEFTLYMALFSEELAKEYGIRVSTESRRVY